RRERCRTERRRGHVRGDRPQVPSLSGGEFPQWRGRPYGRDGRTREHGRDRGETRKIRLPTQFGGRGRRPSPGSGRAARTRRTRYRRRRCVRVGQAPGGGVVARGRGPGDPATYGGGALPASAST